MKRNIFNLGIICTLTLMLFSCIKDPEELRMDFDIALPYGWSSALIANRGFVFIAARDPLSDVDTICENLHVFKASMPGQTLETYYDAALELIQEDDLYQTQIYQSDTVINGTDFKKLISREYIHYLNPEYGDTLHVDFVTERFFFMERGNGYHLVLYSPKTKYPYPNRNTFNLIMNTFQYKY